MNQPWENGKKIFQRFYLRALGPNLGCPIFFPPVTRYHGQLSSCKLLEKTNDPILRKLSHGWTDRQVDGKADKSDLIGCCLTND